MHGRTDLEAETGRLHDLGRADLGRRRTGRHVPAICRSVLGVQSQLLCLGARDVADRRNRALDRPCARRHRAGRDAAVPCGDDLLGSQRARARHHAGAVRGGGAEGHHRAVAAALSPARGRQDMTAADAPDAPLLQVGAITKTFGGVTALDNISVYIRKGERFGLIGPNGSGKTTLINCISGALRPQTGTVVFRGEDITHLPPPLRARRGIARSFQIPRPFKSMTVLENLLGGLDFATVGSSLPEEDVAMSILTRMGLASKAGAPTDTLSQVELRKMEIARALALPPKIV